MSISQQGVAATAKRFSIVIRVFIGQWQGSTSAITKREKMLTPDIVRELRKPFAPEQIKWKVQTNPKEGDEWAVVVAYVDARDVTERLDIAAGGDWSNEYALPQVQAGAHHALECRLTVCGVTRCDVGSVSPPRDGDDATKDLYSDALKRAAVQFGVSSHVYRFPNVKAKVQKFGRSFFLTFKAQDELSDLNKHLIAGTRWSKYTELKVSGDSFGADGKPELFDIATNGNNASYAPPAQTINTANGKAIDPPARAPRLPELREQTHNGANLKQADWETRTPPQADYAEPPTCDICGAVGRPSKKGGGFYCPNKDEAHGGKWYTIPEQVAPAHTELDEADYPPEDLL